MNTKPSQNTPGMLYKPLNQGTLESGHFLEFRLFSSQAQSVFFLLFTPDGKRQIQKFPLIKDKDHIWWGAIPIPDPDCCYCYLIDGKEIADPYSRALTTPHEWMGSTLFHRSQFIHDHTFDWEGVEKPKFPTKEFVIYEMHLRGFTKDPSSRVKHPGTYLGMIEKIPYLKGLGINVVELMPIFEFDETELKDKGLVNYWGYNSSHFFSPMKRYASSPDRLSAICELKTLIRELHRAGIKVVLDVVYNHVSPLMGLEILDKKNYFILSSEGNHTNYTGCGNTLNCNSNASMNLILSSLRYFAETFHVDGFRFDLGGAMTRCKRGEIQESPPIFQAIDHDPFLSHLFFTAEPWDAAGANLQGHLGPPSLSEWNGDYKYISRRFLNLCEHIESNFANALLGFPNLYKERKSKEFIVHYTSSHDGFSLGDVVSYCEKHNLANREENRDGANFNASNNWGAEGETEDLHILEQRRQIRRNFHISNIVSIGIPMITMGDEIGHSHQGNNNPYCHDGPINWLNWTHSTEEQKLFSDLIQIRKDRILNSVERKILIKENGVVVVCYDDHTIVGFNNRRDSYDLASKLSHPYRPIISSGKELSLLLAPNSAVIAIRDDV